MDRREFIKTSAIATGALAASGIVTGCKAKQNSPYHKQDLGPEHMASHYAGIGLLGFGAMRWPMRADKPDEIDQEAVNEMVDYAIAHGVNYFDSAPVYLRGKSERATALALLRHPREKYLIATKCSNMRGDKSLEGGKAMYLTSLENYETDHIDFYLMHSLGGMQSFKERFLDNGLLNYLLEERKAGRIRQLGYSFHGPKEGFDELLALHGKYHWDFVQIQMNYNDWKHATRDVDAEYMYNELASRDIPVVLMEPLLGGRLASLPAPLSDMLKSAEPSQSIASWAFRFVGSFPKVQCALSGMTCMEHLKDNLETFLDFKPLNQNEFDLLERVAAELNKYPIVPCTGCNYCMPCPYGINIPGVFKFYNDNIRDGTYVVNEEQKGYARARKSYLLKYNKAIPTVRQADHCIGCGTCLPACPQQIQIPNQLHRIDRYIERLKEGTLGTDGRRTTVQEKL